MIDLKKPIRVKTNGNPATILLENVPYGGRPAYLVSYKTEISEELTSGVFTLMSLTEQFENVVDVTHRLLTVFADDPSGKACVHCFPVEAGDNHPAMVYDEAAKYGVLVTLTDGVPTKCELVPSIKSADDAVTRLELSTAGEKAESAEAEAPTGQYVEEYIDQNGGVKKRWNPFGGLLN